MSERDYLPTGTHFTTPQGYEFGVISAADMKNAAQVANCVHGCSSVENCQKCWTAAIFHRQVLRMAEWMQRQHDTTWEAGAARSLADEKTREHCGFLPKIGPAPAERDIPPLPPIKLSQFGLVATPAPLEGNAGNVFGLVINRPDGMEFDRVQQALLAAIDEGARWEP